MDKDKQIQKIQIQPIEKLGKKSDLATRALIALGFKKEKERFTIIYPCQFCGRLINYAFTPCIFCGNYPKTKKEAVIANLLSSSSLVEFDFILGVSRAIKDRADLDIVIGNFRELLDDVLENESKYPDYKPFFRMAELSADNEDREKVTGIEYVKRSHITCNRCGQQITIADLPCIHCLSQQQDAEKPFPSNDLSTTEKWIVAMNNFLLFIENYLSNTDNIENLEKLVFVSVYIINHLIEKNELPDDSLKNLWKDLFRKTKAFYAHFGGETAKGSVKVENDKVKIETLESCTDEEQFIIMALGPNLSYLLKS